MKVGGVQWPLGWPPSSYIASTNKMKPVTAIPSLKKTTADTPPKKPPTA